jgi:hypothetical protein
MQSTSRREKMFALCAAWESSGQPREAFCKAHHISLSTFGYWRSRYLAEQQEQNHSFIAVTAQATEAPAGIEIHYPNGVKLMLAQQLPLSELKLLIGLV